MPVHASRPSPALPRAATTAVQQASEALDRRLQQLTEGSSTWAQQVEEAAEELLRTCSRQHQGTIFLQEVGRVILGDTSSFTEMCDAQRLLGLHPQKLAEVLVLGQTARALQRRPLNQEQDFPRLGHGGRSPLIGPGAPLSGATPRPRGTSTGPAAPWSYLRTFAMRSAAPLPAPPAPPAARGAPATVPGVQFVSHLKPPPLPVDATAALQTLADLFVCPLAQGPLQEPVFSLSRGRSVERKAALAADDCWRDDLLMRKLVEAHAVTRHASLSTVWHTLGEHLECPIGLEPLQNPHIDADGHTYTGQQITTCLAQFGFCPQSYTKMDVQALVPHGTVELLLWWWHSCRALVDRTPPCKRK